MSDMIRVYIDEIPGHDIDAYPLQAAPRLVERGALCLVAPETMASWEAARTAWETAQREMRACLEERRRLVQAEVLAYGRVEDGERLARRRRKAAS